MGNIGIMNPAFGGLDAASSGNVINLQDDNENVKKGTPPGWDTFGESDTDPGDVRLHAPNGDTDSGIVPIVGSGKKRNSFHTGDEGGKKGRLNKWFLGSMIFDRVLLVGFIVMIIIVIIAYGTMRN